MITRRGLFGLASSGFIVRPAILANERANDRGGAAFIRADALPGDTQSAIGAWVHPEQFGAVTNPAHDNTDAFKRMRDYVEDAGAAVRLPPGKFLLRDKIVFTRGLSLFGAGQGRTQLGWEGSAVEAGIEVKLSATESDYVTVRDISFVRQGVRASGKALHINGTNQIVNAYVEPRSAHRVLLSGLDVRGIAESTASWADCIHLKSIVGAKLSHINLRGSFTGKIATGIDACRGLICDGEGTPWSLKYTG
ncbi:hypothetical protein G6M04_28745 [Agrobacterium rhizogenes]|uniref:glycosyl hydrolase family 28-related protein n=1 Tax=Rhizobium rhizogenes TaxID=359 RepID=UPI001574C498|nr:glycosyl hydrolase family 28-related protein [Rhizobium rhizogenes]NTG51395.1 hypothetical protein [Rhizobium rhizogenes]